LASAARGGRERARRQRGARQLQVAQQCCNLAAETGGHGEGGLGGGGVGAVDEARQHDRHGHAGQRGSRASVAACFPLPRGGADPMPV
jgi:hypothetical protein